MLKHNLPIKNDVIQKYLVKDMFTNVVIQKKQNKKKQKLHVWNYYIYVNVFHIFTFIST